ncbi:MULTISPECIES: YfjI family protein [unclassified Enterobacter]|uniref:YfjI family protein n=1 Tax=unclassified Enterobacter TaxID=2608935 RepID=UPI0015C8E652|nr:MULTISPECIES: YfjI family protein [unclassified Enterobacter]MBB3303905.1 putative transcriptional regulator [Enterobacter sp. Sphag1F]NYI12990.1 putative transcriptional regulator [Enterobacter sp. Sphag71]
MSTKNEFPYQRLPKLLINVAFEIARATQAPIALIFASMFGVMSLICQRVINVKRPDNLLGPVSLFIVTIAESGERKSSVDKMIMGPLFHIDEKNAEAYRLSYDIYKRDMEIFAVQKQALMSRLKSETKLGINTDDIKERLSVLEQAKPVKPIRQRLIVNDATPAALKQMLANKGASTGLMSDEAGMVFSGKALEQLPMLNKIWDGSSFVVNRANFPELSIKDVRMTMSLMAQPEVVKSFIHRGKGEARHTGFLARCLIGYPESTQGTRLIGDAETSIEHLPNFHKKLSYFAAMTTNDLRIMMHFSSDAEQAWREFYNRIERLIGETGYHSLSEFKDYASKMSENVARLAALIEFFHSSKETISVNAVDVAIDIIEWYGYQYIKLVGEKENPFDDSNFLFQWLIEFCKKHNASSIPKNIILQYGPSRVRKRAKLNALIDILQGRNLVFISYYGRAIMVNISDWAKQRLN